MGIQMNKWLRFSGPVCVVTVVSTVLWVNAGQLSPPAGPINATGPTTLNQQDIGAGPLFSINTSGSYILTSDIVAPGGYTGDGIAILADNVTLNMNGFALIGVPGSQRGIRVTTPTRFNISIYNGTVRDWGGNGVDAFDATNSQLENLRASDNGSDGLHVGEGSTVTNCTARANGNNGIFASTGSAITGCTASVNLNNGIVVGVGSTVTNCTATSNTGTGINAGSGSTITGCTAYTNGFNGIVVGEGSTISGCTARNSTGIGIAVSLGGSTITGCTAYFSSGDGILAGSGSTISGCTARSNGGDGIEANDSLIHGNSSTSNTGAAINDTGGSLLVDNKT